MRHLEELDHTADVGFVVRARSLPGLFYWAARGLLAELFEGPLPPGKEVRTLRLEAPDSETLLVRFLNELIYLVQTRGLVPSGFTLGIGPGGEGCKLFARLLVLPFDAVAERFLGEVKSATFHGLRIEKEGGLYRASVVLDI